MSAELEALCAGLAGEGTTEAADLGFTLESAKAREKLQEFALAQPENFQLLALAGLCALGSRHFKVTIDADDFVVAADQPLEREPFDDLWSYVSRGGADSKVIGLRLLAMALLTSVRLGEMAWSVESADSAGGWRHEAVVRRGLLTERKPFSLPAPAQGVVIRAKRKTISQVARRFMARWLSGALKGERGGPDEALLKERLFLPPGSSLECNGRLLTAGHRPAGGVLAVLTTGGAPTLVDCPVEHRIERDYAVTILLCRPSSYNDPELPGLANHTTWIWNGLRMDSTVLGAELDCVRAFVWAPDLRPDLSFTSLADNRDKQSLERTVRAQARELLDRWVRDFAARIKATPVSPDGNPAALSEPFFSVMAIVRNAIRERIDTRKDWRRFASLNRALLECPLVVGSGADGRRRWIDMGEILGELQAGRPVAVFSRDSDVADVPSWPDRPLVLYTSKADADFFRLRFPQFDLASAATVLSRVRERLSRRPASRPTPVSVAPWLSGQLKVGEVNLEWILDRQLAAALSAGQLWVHSAGGGSFCDESMALPSGLVAQASAQWEQSYRGELMDRQLASEVKRALMTGVTRAIAARGNPPDAEGYALSGLVLAALKGPDQLEAAARDVAWLVVRTLDGDLRWVSPKDLQAALDALEAPPYAAEWPFIPPSDLPPEWKKLPVALVSKASEPGLTHLLGRAVMPALNLVRIDKQPPPWNGDDLLWTGVLESDQAGRVDPGLRSFTLGILKTMPTEGHAEVRESLFGRYLRRGHYSGIPTMLRISVDWSHGWPDSSGDKRAESKLRVARLKKGCLALLQRFFQEMTAAELRRASPQVIGALMFELLADDGVGNEPVFLLGDGRRVSLSEIPATRGEVRYFSHPIDKAPADAVYLPGPMQEAIGLVSELSWVAVEGKTEPPSEPSSETAPVSAKPDPHLVTPAPRVPASPAPGSQPPRKPTPARTEVEDAPKETISLASSPAPSEAIILHPVPSVAPRKVLEPMPPPVALTARSSGSPLQVELAELSPGFEQEWTDFADFVAAARVDSSQAAALHLDGERVVLGKPCEKALKTRQGRRILLYTLFSLFRRSREKFGPDEARLFHQAILTASLNSPGS